MNQSEREMLENIKDLSFTILNSKENVEEKIYLYMLMDLVAIATIPLWEGGVGTWGSAA